MKLLMIFIFQFVHPNIYMEPKGFGTTNWVRHAPMTFSSFVTSLHSERQYSALISVQNMTNTYLLAKNHSIYNDKKNTCPHRTMGLPPIYNTIYWNKPIIFIKSFLHNIDLRICTHWRTIKINTEIDFRKMVQS